MIFRLSTTGQTATTSPLSATPSSCRKKFKHLIVIYLNHYNCIKTKFFLRFKNSRFKINFKIALGKKINVNIFTVSYYYFKIEYFSFENLDLRNYSFSILFNSVPLESIQESSWGSDTTQERTRARIREMIVAPEKAFTDIFFQSTFNSVPVVVVVAAVLLLL